MTDHGSLERGSIVVGVDFSPASERALDAAIDAALQWNVTLALVHAAKPLGAPGLDLTHPPVTAADNESADLVAEAGANLPEDWLERARDAGVDCEYLALAGSPADVLVREAEERGASAIVVGTHGRSGLGKAALGSVAEAVVAKSTVPVMVVPDHGMDVA